MRKLAFKYPIAFSVVVFLVVTALTTGVGVLLGLLLMMNSGAQDPRHGGAMAAGAVWFLMFWAGVFFGIVSGIVTLVYLKVRSKKLDG